MTIEGLIDERRLREPKFLSAEASPEQEGLWQLSAVLDKQAWEDISATQHELCWGMVQN